MNDNEEYQVKRIPDNFGNGINIAGFHFEVIFLIEGVVLAITTTLLSLVIMTSIGMTDIGQMLGFALVFACVSLVIGIRGVNDEPLTTFLSNVSKFNKNRRTAYYNPRIKKEAKPVTQKQLEENKDAIPREKIIAFFNKYKSVLDKKQQEKAKLLEDANSFDAQNMYFEDDIGIIKRPNQYMSKEEAEKYDKKKEKASKFRKNNLKKGG